MIKTVQEYLTLTLIIVSQRNIIFAVEKTDNYIFEYKNLL